MRLVRLLKILYTFLKAPVSFLKASLNLKNILNLKNGLTNGLTLDKINMYKIYLTIAIIALFCFKQSHESKKYKVEPVNQMQFNAKELHAVIADVWNINN